MTKRGPKTKNTPEVRKKLEEAAALDCTIEEMCFYAGITKPTYYEWIAANPELSARLEALRNEPVLAARTTIIKSLTQPQTAAWYLERKRKLEFTPRTEHTGANGEKLFDNDTRDKAKKAVGSFLDQRDTGKGE